MYVAPNPPGLQHNPKMSNVAHPLPSYGSTPVQTSMVTSMQTMQSPAISHPKFPSPMPNQLLCTFYSTVLKTHLSVGIH
jgi:hypothetical protein